MKKVIVKAEINLDEDLIDEMINERGYTKEEILAEIQTEVKRIQHSWSNVVIDIEYAEIIEVK